MSDKHTPTPWREGQDISIRGHDLSIGIICATDNGSALDVEARENLRRMRVCVNACASISTADLEAGVVGEMVQVLKEGRRAIGDHHVPDDCYATGPATGDEYRDLIECPACSFIQKYDALLSKIGA